MGAAAPGIIKQKRVNLLNASYAAVEILVQKSGKDISTLTPVAVDDLTEMVDMDAQHPKANPKVGRVLSSQMRERFVQLGYTVLDQTTYKPSSSYAQVSGSYRIKDGTMDVLLNMVDKTSGKIVATHSYSLPVTYDIKKYMTQDANSLPALPPLL